MKTPNTLKMMALIALISVGASWGAANVSAQTQTSSIKEIKEVTRDDPFFHTGMFGITQNQTARINVANLDDGSFVPCIKVELSFVDRQGNILSQKVYDIEAGKAAFLDLKAGDIAERDSNRTQLRVLVRFVGTPDTRDDPFFLDSCVVTLEVFDNESGETRFLLPAVQKVQKVQEGQRNNNEDK